MGYLKNRGKSYRSVLLVAASATVAAIASSPAPLPAEQAAVNRRILCRYAGRPVYVRGAAGCGYARGLAIFRWAYHKWGPGTAAEYGLIPPLALSLKPPRHHWPKKMYTACLDGVLASYTRYKVVSAIEAQWHPKLSQFVDVGGIPNALKRQAFLLHKGSAILDRGLLKGWSASQFCHAYRAAFPHVGSTTEIRRFYWPHEYTPRRALYFAINKAFPQWRAKLRGPSGWQRYNFYAGLEQLCIGAIVQKNRRFFVRLAAERYGSWHFIIAIRAEGGEPIFDAIRALTASMGGARGAISPASFMRATRILNLLGSPTRFALFSGGQGYISVLSGRRLTAVTPEIFLKAKCPANERPGYIYVYDPTPARKLGETKGGSPVSFVYAAAEDYIVRPVVKKVLRKIRPGPGLRLPTAKWLRDNMWDSLLFFNFAGTPIPSVIIKTPWPSSDASLYSGRP